LEERLAAAEREEGEDEELVNVDEFDDETADKDGTASAVDSDFAAELVDEISKAVAAPSSDEEEEGMISDF
jgi:hypothetical protein